MSANCEKCLKNINKRSMPGVKCGMCMSLFHIKCAELNATLLKDVKLGTATWLCPDCRSTSNTTIIDSDYEGNEDSTGTINPKLSDLVQMLNTMQSKLDAMVHSFDYICKTIEDLKATMNCLTKGVQCSDEKLIILEKKLEAHEDKINTMEALLDRTNQHLNQANIVISGIPDKCEDVPSIIIKIVNLLGVQIIKDDLLSVKQMVHRNKQSDSLLKNAFIVSFRTAEIKNEILNLFRKKKSIHWNELAADFSSTLQNQRIFLLHHLTKFQSMLYSAAKNIKTNHKFQFLWCKHNNIYLRKTADSKILHIFSFNDINRINKNLYPPDSSETSVSPLLDIGSSSTSEQ